MNKKTMDIPVEKNKCYSMLVDDLGNAGEGIGKIDGFTVFVEGALPQEEIEVLIVKVKKKGGQQAISGTVVILFEKLIYHNN